MKKRHPLKVVAVTFFTVLLFSVTVSGVDFPATMKAGDSDLVYNGAGVRTKLFKLYAQALYLGEKCQDAEKIINADEPMAMKQYIKSKLVSAGKMKSAIDDGFEKSTNGNTSAIATEIQQFKDMFSNGVSKHDSFDYVYVPGVGTTVSKNGEEIGVIAGLEFKKALFGMWLGEKPVQGGLKDALLGK
jgi:hypothetical protein